MADEEYKNIGREDQKKELLGMLTEGKARVFVISGPPGSGKSQFVEEVYHLYECAGLGDPKCTTKRTELVRIDGQGIGSNVEFLQTVANVLPMNDKYDLPAEDNEVEQMRIVKRVTAILNNLRLQHIIFFFDNFDANRKDIALSFIVKLFKQREKPSNVTFIVTSVLSLNSATVKFKLIHLRPFTNEEARQLFKVNFSLDVSEKFVQDVNEICSGNPQVLQLVGTDFRENYFTTEEMQFLLKEGKCGDVLNRDNVAESEQRYNILEHYLKKRVPAKVSDRLLEVLHFKKKFKAEDLNPGDEHQLAKMKNDLVPLIRSNAVDFDPQDQSMQVPPVVRQYHFDKGHEEPSEQEACDHLPSQPSASISQTKPGMFQDGSTTEQLSKLSINEIVEAKGYEEETRSVVETVREQDRNELSPGGSKTGMKSEESLNPVKEDAQINQNLQGYYSDKEKVDKIEQADTTPVSAIQPAGSVTIMLENNINENIDNPSSRHASSDPGTEENYQQPPRKMNISVKDSFDDNTEQQYHDPDNMTQRGLKSHTESMPQVHQGETKQDNLQLDSINQKKYPQLSPKLIRNTSDTSSFNVPPSPGASVNMASAGPEAMTERTAGAHHGHKSQQDQTIVKPLGHSDDTRASGYSFKDDSKQCPKDSGNVTSSLQYGHGELPSAQRYQSSLNMAPSTLPVQHGFGQNAVEPHQWTKNDRSTGQIVHRRSQHRFQQPPLQPLHHDNVVHTEGMPFNQSQMMNYRFPNNQGVVGNRTAYPSNTDFTDTHQQLRPEMTQRQPVDHYGYNQQRAPVGGLHMQQWQPGQHVFPGQAHDQWFRFVPPRIPMQFSHQDSHQRLPPVQSIDLNTQRNTQSSIHLHRNHHPYQGHHVYMSQNQQQQQLLQQHQQQQAIHQQQLQLLHQQQPLHQQQHQQLLQQHQNQQQHQQQQESGGQEIHLYQYPEYAAGYPPEDPSIDLRYQQYPYQ